MIREFQGTLIYPDYSSDRKILFRIAGEEKPFWVPLTLQPCVKDLKAGDRVRIKANPERVHWFVTEIAALSDLEAKPPQEQRPAVNAGSKAAPEAAPHLTMLPIEQISGTLNGLERSGDDPELDELAESMKAQGVIEPIIAMLSPGTMNVYLAVAGNRRVAAAQKAGLEKIPAIIRPYNREEAYLLGLIENIQRKDISDYEKGRRLKQLMDEFPQTYPTQEALAVMIGKSVSWISRHIEAFETGEAVKPYLPIGKLEKMPESAFRELRKVPEEERPKVLEALVEAPVEGAYEKPLSARRIAEKAGPEPIDTGEVWTCTVCQEKFRLIHYSSGRHKLAPEVITDADSPSQPTQDP